MQVFWDVGFNIQAHRNVCNSGELQDNAWGCPLVKCEASVCTASF